jgi:drug/metabolite transporter (DMT)-like permease
MTAHKREAYILIAILAIVWGSSFILIKRALDVYTPVQVGALRMFVAFLFMLPFIIKHFGKIEKSKWKYLAATGFLGNGIPSILFPLAETRINSALAGMINTLTPIFTLIVGMVFFKMKVGNNRIFGLIIGLIGAVLLITGRVGGISIDAANSYALFVVLSTICYGFSVNILRNKLSDIDSIRITGFALFFAGLPFGILLFSGDFISRTQNISGAGMSIFYVLILGIMGTSFSTILFNKLVKISGALSAASVTYLIPIVAVMWGVLDNEVIGLYQVVGLLAILFGVYMVNRQKSAV